MPDENAISWKKRGDKLAINEEYEEAIKCYSEAICIDPDFSDCWNNMGFAYSKLGRKNDAKRCRNKINEINNRSKAISNIDNFQEEVKEMRINKEPIIKKIQVQEGIQKVSKNLTKKSLSIIDSIGGAVKSGSRKISYNILKRNQIIHIKKLIIYEFSLKELKKLCLYFDIGKPTVTRVNQYNEIVYVKPTFSDWANYVLKNLEFVKLKEYANMHNKFPYKIVELENQYKQERIDKFPEFENKRGVTFSEISEGSCDPALLNELVNAINEYRPIKPFRNELLYHTNLYTFLCEKIPGEIGFEEQRGSSRPDIVVGDIAIEIKGPTDRQGLITIADKINRYSQYFDHIIVVLFEVEVYEQFYHEWYEGIMRQYQNQVTILRK